MTPEQQQARHAQEMERFKRRLPQPKFVRSRPPVGDGAAPSSGLEWIVPELRALAGKIDKVPPALVYAAAIRAVGVFAAGAMIAAALVMRS